MTYRMNWDIRVGRYKLRTVGSVTVSKSVENLADSAVIVLPGTHVNAVLRTEDKIAEGDEVEIRLGYDDSLETEFKGYLNRIVDRDGSLCLECEDELYVFRKPVKNAEFKSIGLKSLLERLVEGIGSRAKVDCDLDFRYESFAFFKDDGLDVLKKIQEETQTDVYFADGVLHVHAPYSKVIGRPVRFDPARNIEKTDLTYVAAKHKKVEVEVVYTDAKGKKATKKFGRPGGTVERVTAGSIDPAAATKIAENAYARMASDGYEGGFTGWLVPYVEPCYAVRLSDERFPERNRGDYYVVGVEVAFDDSGGSRTVKLGRRL